VLRGKRLSSLFVLLVLVILSVSLEQAFAFTFYISPNPATVGQPITFSGTDQYIGHKVDVFIYSGIACSKLLFTRETTAQPSGDYSVTLSGLSVGSYGASAFDFPTFISTMPACVPFTVNPA
jgi:hypothetical protein